MVLRVTLLSVNEMRKLSRVSQEEDRSVVEDPVHVALLSPELDREASRVTSTVGRAGLATYCGESNGNGALGLRAEEWCKAEIGNRVGGAVDTVSSSTLGVNDTLRNALSVEVREEIDEVEVLEKKGTFAANTLCLVGVRNNNAIRGAVRAGLGVGILLKRSDSET